MNIFGNHPINNLRRVGMQQRRMSNEMSPLSPSSRSTISSVSSRGSMRNEVFLDMAQVDKIRKLRDKYSRKSPIVRRRNSSPIRSSVRRNSRSPRRSSPRRSSVRRNRMSPRLSSPRRRHSSPLRMTKRL